MLGLESQVELGLQTSPTGFAALRQALNVYKITGGQTRSRPEDPILNAGFENLTDPTEPGPGLPDHKVTVEVPLCIAQFPFWLRSFFGAPTTSGEDPDLEHAFKSGRALQYASIQHRLQSGDYRRHVGLVGEEMKIALNPEADGFARVTITYVGIDEERDTATAADGEVTAEPALDRPAEALAKVIWNAVEGGQLIGGELTFKRNLKRIRAADGTGKPSRIEYNGKSSLTGSVRLRYADQTIISDAWSRTERALGLELMRDVGRGVKFLCGQALLDETPIGADGPDGVEVDVPVTAYQAPSAPALTVTALTEVNPVLLAALSLEPAEATVGVAYSGLIAGRTAGSTLTLTGPGAAGLSVNSTTGAVTGTPTAAGAVNIVETLAGAPGSPRTTPNALETGEAPASTRRALVANSFTTTAANTMVACSTPDKSRKSNGTHNSFNVAFGMTAVSDMTNPAPAFVGWTANASGEFIADNAMTIHAQIEYPIGGAFYDCGTFEVAAGAVLKEAPTPAPITISAGDRYTVRYYGTVANGAYFYYNGVFVGTNKGVFAEVGVDLTDKSGGTTLTGTGIQMPGHFVGVMADIAETEETDVLYCDSLVASTDSNPMTQALRGDRSFVIMSYSGSSASFDANPLGVDRISTYRVPFVAAAGFTAVHCDLGVNDFGANFTASQLKTALEYLAAKFKSVGVAKFYGFKITPRSGLVSGQSWPSSDTNQVTYSGPNNDGTITSFTSGQRQTHNAAVVAGTINGMDGYWDWATPAENALDDDWWKASWTADGLHFRNVADIGSPAKSAQTLAAEYLRANLPAGFAL